MSLDKGKVEKVAHLARLAINEEDIPQYVRDLSDILDLVSQMNAAGTTGVTPMAHPLDDVQRMRPDEITEVNQRRHLQRTAPLSEGGLYLVPKVIE